MTREEYIKELILSRYKSVRAFSIESGIANSTLKSMFINGIEKTAIGTIIKVCKKLGISVEGLANYEQKEIDPALAKSISDEKLLIIYNSLPDEEKRDLDEYIKYLQSRKKGQ